jgi:hypothetical protein
MEQPRYARLLDSRLEALSENRVCYVLKEGAAVQSFVPLVASSFSNQSITFNLNNIADFTARDSRLAIQLTARVVLNFTNTTGSPIKAITGDNFGNKQFPVNRAFSSIQHQINQASYTLQTNEILDSITRLNLLPSDCNFYENTMPDLLDSYGVPASGCNFSPLQPYNVTLAGDGVYKPRTLQLDVSQNDISGNSTGQVVITATYYEPLISPFCNVSSDDARALYAITGELITINFVPDLFNNMFAYDIPTGLTLSSSSVDLTTVNPVLRCIYLTPKEDTIAQVPRSSIYQYNDYSIFQNTIASGVVAGGTLSGVSSQVVNFTNLPSKILVYARLSNNARTSETPDKYLALTGLQVTFDNGLPQLAGATPDQLYDISKRNAIQMPRACWKQEELNSAVSATQGGLYGCGSVLILDPALDLGIRPSDTQGSGGRYIFQVQNATFKNFTETNFGSITLYVVGINSAVLERVGSQYRNYLLTTPPDIINEIKSLAPISYKMYMRSNHANSFFMGGGIGDWFKKAYNFGTRSYNQAKDLLGEVEKTVSEGQDIYNKVRKLTGGAMDRGTRLFGANPRPQKQLAFYQ